MTRVCRDFFAVAQFALSALKTLQTILSPGDQYHLYATASRALATAKRRGDNHSVEYWAGRPVLGIALAPCVDELLFISFESYPVRQDYSGTPTG